MKSIDLAIVGATGAVGEAVVELLEKRDLPVNSLHLLASERTAGTSLMFKRKPIMVTDLKHFDFSKVQLAIFVANDAVSSEVLPQAQSQGCLAIDNSQVYSDSAPLIVPGVNGELLAAKPEIIVNPESTAIQLATLLKPMAEAMGLARVNVTALHSVSGHGKKAINELASQAVSLLNGRGAKTGIYPQQIAFNLLPYVGPMTSDGHAEIEKRIFSQTRRLLNDAELMINVSCVQAPVFYADSMVVNIELNHGTTVSEILHLLQKNSEINVLDGIKTNDMATPVTHATGKESIFVSRIRRDMSHENSFNLWVTTDNVRKSAAFNTILIIEELIKSYL